MLQYSFDADLAKDYGVPEAIFVHRLYWWVHDNAANNRNLKDGRYWTYDSLAALTKIFPFWSRRQIEGVINRCRDKGLILTAVYSEDRRDRTTWYTVTEPVFQVYRGTKKTPPKEGEAYPQTGKCTAQESDASITKRGNVYKEQLKDQLEDERERTREKPQNPSRKQKPAKPKEPKDSYGEFGNVSLTKRELEKLLDRWTPQQVKREVEALSAYMKSKGKAYKDHYATLLVWMKRDFPAGQAAAGGRVLIDNN